MGLVPFSGLWVDARSINPCHVANAGWQAARVSEPRSGFLGGTRAPAWGEPKPEGRALAARAALLQRGGVRDGSPSGARLARYSKARCVHDSPVGVPLGMSIRP